MQIGVSYCISDRVDSLRPLILLEDVKRLLEQVTKHCRKISVAKVNLPPLVRPSDTNCGGHVPIRKRLRSLRTSATFLSIVSTIVHPLLRRLATMISKGLSIISRQFTTR